jgi:acyl-CoA synthetase (AMP-forming)/AMP-acid ligase II
MNVIDFLDRGAERFPQRHVVHDGERGTTYAEFVALTHRIAAALHASGLAGDAHVATVGPNSALGYAVQHGVIRSGRIWAPLNVRNSADENIEILKLLDVQWLFFHSSFAAEIERIRVACPLLRGLVCIDRVAADAPALADWMAPVGARADERLAAANDVYAILTTSGTTGRPKGVLLSHLAFESMAANFNVAMPMNEPPVHLVAAPLTHAAGMFAGSMLMHGATHLIVPKPDPALILDWIERHRVTTLFLPPTLIYMLLAHPDIGKHDYSSLRHFLYCAAPMSAEKLVEASAVFGNVFFQVFGQTEALMIMTNMSAKEHAEALADPAKRGRLLSCGRASPYVRVAVMDDDGRILPGGEAGEIVVRGNIVMNGYYNNPQATAEVSAHGWHHTGDIGRIDADGFVYLVDRKKDMIVSGGFNVYPSEVEQVLWKHPAVQDCAVVGVPDDKWGEAVVAVVELKAGQAVSAEDLIALCKAKVGSVKAPKRVEFWPALPRSTVGKVLKREIRSHFWAGRERLIN